MGNTNFKEVSIRSFEPNISNMSFNLNDDSVLIPFFSNTINRIFIDRINKSTNLNFFNSNSILNNNNSHLNQEIKFTQMIGDLLDKNIQSDMENNYNSEEEILYNNILNLNQNKMKSPKINKNIIKSKNNNKKENNETSLNISIENSDKNEFQVNLSQTSNKQYSNHNKQMKMVKIGKKEDFKNSSSKEKNNIVYTRLDNNNKLENYKIGKIYVFNQKHKKSNSPKSQNINKIQIKTQPRKVRSIERNNSPKDINNNKNENIIKNNSNISPSRNIACSPMKSPQPDTIKYFNLHKNLQSPKSESTNYSNNQSIIKQRNNDLNINNSYVMMKMKKDNIGKRTNNLTSDNLNIKIMNQNKKNNKINKNRDFSFDNIIKNVEKNNISPIRKESISPKKKKFVNPLYEKFNLTPLHSPKMGIEKLNKSKNKKEPNKKSKQNLSNKNKIFELDISNENINGNFKKSYQKINTQNIDKKKNISHNSKKETKMNKNSIIEYNPLNINNNDILNNNINHNHLVNESFNINEEDNEEEKNKKFTPSNCISYSNLSEKSNFTSRFNSNPQQNQISYTMKDCTSFGDFNINEYNSKNTQSSNNNNEIYKNSLKISKLNEFKNKQEIQNIQEKVSNSLNSIEENKFQSNTLKELYANYRVRGESIKNDNLGIIKEENPFEKTNSHDNDNFSFHNKILESNKDNNIMTVTHYIIDDGRCNKKDASNNKNGFQITSEIRDSEFNDIDF